MSALQDLRHAARRLRRSPVFTLTAIAILAVGLGLNATVFSVVDTMLLAAPPWSDPDRVVHIYQDSDDGEPSSTAYPAYRDMTLLTDVFAGVAATSRETVTWEHADGPRQAAAEFATASYFPVLGLVPSRGRWFAPEHDVVGSEMVAVISHRTWRTQLGGDPGVVGRTIRLNNQSVTIIGVGPANFNGEAGALVTDFWLSISSTPVGGPFRVANLDRREDHWYQVKARLAPGVTLARAQAALDALAEQHGALYPDLDKGRGITAFAYDEIRFHPSVDADLRAIGGGIFAVALLVLLLACSNLANLLLVRGLARVPELAVRQALGAGGLRLGRLVLLEALLLSLLGGAAGLVLAAWSIRILPTLPLPSQLASLDLAFDVRMIAFGITLALATGLLFGLVPAFRSTRTDVAAALREEARGGTAGRGVMWLRAGLTGVQVAISLVLIVAAGLLARSLGNAQRVDPGVDADRIAVLGTSLSQPGRAAADAQVTPQRILERMAAVPGVERVALTTRLPLRPGGTTTQVIDGYEPQAGTGSVELPFAFVSRDYFETMGIRTLAGRTFTPTDGPGSPRVLVVNETAARLYWGGDALGGRIRPQGAPDGWGEVVGVVADSKVNSLQEPATPMIYYAAEQAAIGAFQIVARTPGDPAALAPALRTALREVDASLPITGLTTLETMLGATLATPRLAARLMGFFSILALVLACLGVYAVVSFSVERRARELGIRIALGAATGRVIGMVVRESLVVVMVGILAGLLLAAVGARGLQGMLFGVAAADAPTMFGSAVLLLLAAGAAAFLPARRAAGADPASPLRSR